MNGATNWNLVAGGVFLGSLFYGVLLAVPLLFLLRFSVRRYMRRRAGAEAAAVPVLTESAAPPPLHVNAPALETRMRRARGTAALLYAIAGTAAAAVGGVHCLWPALLVMASVAVPSFPVRLTGLLVLYPVLCALLESFGEYTFVSTLLLMLVVNRWVRTISLVMTLVLFAVFAAFTATLVVDESYGNLARLAAAVPFLALSLGLVHLIVRAYERKLFSDASYQFMFVWLVFVPAWVSIGKAWRPTLAALAVYAAITVLTLPLLRRAARRHPPVSLLVLRVFGAPGRSLRLFEQVGARWRYIGPMHLIAGADSATANLDLSEAVRYLTFRFRSLYVSGEADLVRRLAALDCAPDPDGRYRVNDFFCFADTWQATVARLLGRSHVVLVDLSGYGPANQGVRYELELLAKAGRLDSCVIVTDGSVSAAEVAGLVGQPVSRLMVNPKASILVKALCEAAR